MAQIEVIGVSRVNFPGVLSELVKKSSGTYCVLMRIDGQDQCPNVVFVASGAPAVMRVHVSGSSRKHRVHSHLLKGLIGSVVYGPTHTNDFPDADFDEFWSNAINAGKGWVSILIEKGTPVHVSLHDNFA